MDPETTFTPAIFLNVEMFRDDQLINTEIPSKAWHSDDDEDQTHACQFCSKTVDEGVCLFDIRDGSFQMGVDAKTDYFCDRDCLFEYMLTIKAKQINKKRKSNLNFKTKNAKDQKLIQNLQSFL